MSKILEKPFNAAKKILRSVFLGAPNLFTSSDLNRQIESLQSQLDNLNKIIGVKQDNLQMAFGYSGRTLSATCGGGRVQIGGSLFVFPEEDSVVSTDVNVTEGTDVKVYLHLVADTQLVTYNDDFSHEISGARFEDGTSQPAANQIVYINERFVLSLNPDVEGSLGILYRVILRRNSVFVGVITENWMLGSSGVIQEKFEYDNDLGTLPSDLSLKKGDSFSLSLRKVSESLSRYMGRTKTYLPKGNAYEGSGATSSGFSFKLPDDFKINDGDIIEVVSRVRLIYEGGVNVYPNIFARFVYSSVSNGRYTEISVPCTTVSSPNSRYTGCSAFITVYKQGDSSIDSDPHVTIGFTRDSNGNFPSVHLRYTDGFTYVKVTPLGS